MGRVIKLDTPGKQRKQLTRAIVLALRELMKQTSPDNHTRDLAAFITLALEEIDKSIDSSVVAWEKRGYWLKADRFRLDWIWSGQLADAMRAALLIEDWPGVAGIAVQVAAKLNDVELPKRNTLGTPWEGAWQKLREKHGRNGWKS